MYEVIEEYMPGDNSPKGLIKDQRIGIFKNKRSIEIRRILWKDMESQKTYTFITNNFDLSTERIAAIYRQRWQIESMFRRLKQNFPLKYFLGDSQNAIEIQIWCGLIVQLLMLVIQRKVSRRLAFCNMVSMIRFHLMTYIDLFKFIENPNQKWSYLTAKPPNKQLSLFKATPLL